MCIRDSYDIEKYGILDIPIDITISCDDIKEDYGEYQCLSSIELSNREIDKIYWIDKNLIIEFIPHNNLSLFYKIVLYNADIEDIDSLMHAIITQGIIRCV